MTTELTQQETNNKIPNSTKITFAEYLNYDNRTNKSYELVEGNLVEMTPASFLHSDIIDFIADCFKAIRRLREA